MLLNMRSSHPPSRLARSTAKGFRVEEGRLQQFNPRQRAVARSASTSRASNPTPVNSLAEEVTQTADEEAADDPASRDGAEEKKLRRKKRTIRGGARCPWPVVPELVRWTRLLYVGEVKRPRTWALWICMQLQSVPGCSWT